MPIYIFLSLYSFSLSSCLSLFSSLLFSSHYLFIYISLYLFIFIYLSIYLTIPIFTIASSLLYPCLSFLPYIFSSYPSVSSLSICLFLSTVSLSISLLFLLSINPLFPSYYPSIILSLSIIQHMSSLYPPSYLYSLFLSLCIILSLPSPLPLSISSPYFSLYIYIYTISYHTVSSSYLPILVSPYHSIYPSVSYCLFPLSLYHSSYYSSYPPPIPIYHTVPSPSLPILYCLLFLEFLY